MKQQKLTRDHSDLLGHIPWPSSGRSVVHMQDWKFHVHPRFLPTPLQDGIQNQCGNFQPLHMPCQQSGSWNNPCSFQIPWCGIWDEHGLFQPLSSILHVIGQCVQCRKLAYSLRPFIGRLTISGSAGRSISCTGHLSSSSLRGSTLLSQHFPLLEKCKCCQSFF